MLLTFTNLDGCSELQAPPNGHVNISTSRPVKARYGCNEGFSLIGQETLTCLQGGTWTGLQPICIRLLCSRPSPPLNGRVRVSGVGYTAVATYSCFDGYMLLGSKNRTCQWNNFWSGITPVCVLGQSNACYFYIVMLIPSLCYVRWIQHMYL